MRTIKLYSLIAASALVFFTMTAFTLDHHEDGNNKLIKFSHQFHIGDVEVACEDCHTGVTESTSLSDRLMPEKDVCSDCHDTDDDESCETCHYEDVYEPLVEKTASLFFSHSQHMGEEANCEACHQGLSEVDYSSEIETAHPAMSTCYQCHNDQSLATNTCESCHKTTNDLVPATHQRLGFMDNHKITALEADADCAMCHDNNFCESCHVSTIALDVTNSKTDFYTPYSPHRLVDNQNMQQITLVHELNYRYSHGIDAKGRDTECQTCHQVETFCAECHDSEGGDFALGGFVPFSHGQSNFVTIGVGSGGGEHAILANRDIESCANCHDVYGADPNCTLCHVDNDGIQGTNPKTHITGFMEGENGDWHGDMGSVCYDCHTDPYAMSQTYGQGFCGYCHN
jgi:hypothetical protein